MSILQFKMLLQKLSNSKSLEKSPDISMIMKNTHDNRILNGIFDWEDICSISGKGITPPIFKPS